MTVKDNMGFGLKMNGHPKTEIEEKVAEATRILKLEPYLDRKPAALSGGQRQRVSIGRAIVRGPEVFLFDAHRHGSGLDGPEMSSLGAQYVEAMRGFVTHSQRGEVSSSTRTASHGQDRELEWPAVSILGAQCVDAMRGFVSFSQRVEGFLFDARGHGSQLDWPRISILVAQYGEAMSGFDTFS